MPRRKKDPGPPPPPAPPAFQYRYRLMLCSRAATICFRREIDYYASPEPAFERLKLARKSDEFPGSVLWVEVEIVD